jgi:hypothetical protein
VRAAILLIPHTSSWRGDGSLSNVNNIKSRRLRLALLNPSCVLHVLSIVNLLHDYVCGGHNFT